MLPWRIILKCIVDTIACHKDNDIMATGKFVKLTVLISTDYQHSCLELITNIVPVGHKPVNPKHSQQTLTLFDSTYISCGNWL